LFSPRGTVPFVQRVSSKDFFDLANDPDAAISTCTDRVSQSWTSNPDNLVESYTPLLSSHSKFLRNSSNVLLSRTLQKASSSSTLGITLTSVALEGLAVTDLSFSVRALDHSLFLLFAHTSFLGSSGQGFTGVGVLLVSLTVADRPVDLRTYRKNLFFFTTTRACSSK
jgi:hypothetical protein